MKASIANSLLECTGCYACANICPKNCIELKSNKEGFVYPIVNEKECIHCNLCKKICPANNELKGNSIIKTYSGYHNDVEVLYKSTSGGIFTALSQVAFSKNGIVFGAQYDELLSKVFISCAQDIEGIDKYRQSKYFQAEVGFAFRDVKSLLNQGKFVLYSGTPCQIAGLKAFLGKDYSNLLTMDFVCHGVASPLLFQIYKNEVEKQTKKNLTAFRFRDNSKENPYHPRHLSYDLDGCKAFNAQCNENAYFNVFANNYINRLSCSTCKYASTVRVADVTVADKVYDNNEQENQNGNSYVTINTIKGEKFFDEVKKLLTLREENCEQVLSVCFHLRIPSPAHPYRQLFFKRALSKGFNYAYENRETPPFINRLKSKIKKILVKE